MIKTDVCIVGAGPAGASTSIMLSKLKIPHYIIDKASFPRDKTCGDGLILYAYKSLKILGDDVFKAFLNHPKFLHSTKINLHVNDDLKVTFQEDENRDMIISYAKRLDFDHFLIKNLSETYATCEFGNAVKAMNKNGHGVVVKLKDGKEIQTKLIVGADGVQSMVSRKLAGNKIDRMRTSTFVSAYFDNVKGMPEDHQAEVRIIYKNMPLFFYIFPLADGTVNVSLGGRADKIQQHDIHLIEELKSIISNHSKVSEKFIDAKKVSAWRGWSIPFHFGKQKVCGDHFMLVGDAAGLANAFYKEGVGTGMMSGILCAQKIKECLETSNFSQAFLASYERELKSEFGKLLKFSRFSLKMAQYKSIFSTTTRMFKSRIEAKTPGMVKRRSY